MGDTLDLRQGVRGQKDRPALGADLAEQFMKVLLDQRIETGDRLIQDQQLGLASKRSTNASRTRRSTPPRRSER